MAEATTTPDAILCAHILVSMKMDTREQLLPGDRLEQVIQDIAKRYRGVTTAPEKPNKRKRSIDIDQDLETTGGLPKARKLNRTRPEAARGTTEPAASDRHKDPFLSPPTTNSELDEEELREEPRRPRRRRTVQQPTPSLSSSSPSLPSARPGSQTDGDSDQTEGQHAFKRDNTKPKSLSSQMGACMKAVFNQWEGDKDATDVLKSGIYQCGRDILPDDGPGSYHHEDEIALAAAHGLTKANGKLDEYYVRKYRVILGFAFFAEHNLRLRQSKGKHPRYIDFNKTQAQMFPRGDVNTTSEWFSRWKAWGWIPDMKTGKSALNPELETVLPYNLRQRLINEAIKYEDEHFDENDNWHIHPAIARNA